MGKDCPYGIESIRRSAVIDIKTGVVGTSHPKILQNKET